MSQQRQVRDQPKALSRIAILTIGPLNSFLHLRPVIRFVIYFTWLPPWISVRDEFSAKTIRTLAARVGYHCSNPTCVRSTSGPSLDEASTVNIGVGAHIAAADAGGKRYDPRMSPAERSSGNNGIWLCQSCSKLD